MRSAAREQVRRTLRASSKPPVVNNKENATSRAVRASTRAKPPSTVADAKAATLASRATSSTAATRAKSLVPVATHGDAAPVGKRKREALGEVPRPPANVVRQEREGGPATTALKGKGKASSTLPAKKEVFDAVELKKPASNASRAPLKVMASASKTVTTTTTTTTRRTRSITANADVKEEAHHIQRVPSHSQIPSQSSSQPVAGHSRQRSQSSRLAQVKETEEPQENHAIVVEDDVAMTMDAHLPATRGLSVRRANNATTTVQARREGLQRAHSHARARTEIEKDEDEYHRAYKKQRTSSEAPEEPRVKVEHSSHLFLRGYDPKFEPEEEALPEEEEEEDVEKEADPNGDGWEDLDAEDADDPLMVSEYVVDIFNYLKEVEQTTMPNPNYMEMQRDLAWKMRGILNDWLVQVHSDRKSTRLNSSHSGESRMPSSA